jgi:hypothetical protein
MMIKAIQNCYAYTWNSIKQVRNFAVDTLNKTIQFIAEHNLGLIAFALGCAFFHDYNIVLLYGVIGGIFYKYVPEIAETVDAIYQACFLVFKPLTDYKIFNKRLLKYPIYGLIYLSGGVTYILLKPLTLILTEAYLCIRSGAALAAASRNLVERFKARNENQSEMFEV